MATPHHGQPEFNGTLSRVLAKYFNLNLPIFDPYIVGEGSDRYVARENLGAYKTVINSAIFGHVIERGHLATA